MGIDIGGGSVKAALVDVVEGRVCGDVERWPTPSGGSAEAMIQGITEFAAAPTIPLKRLTLWRKCAVVEMGAQFPLECEP